MLLYIHVPFCRKKCRYCAFFSLPLSREGLELYVDTLLKEIAFRADLLGRPPVETVFMGGGTPSLLPPNVLSAIVDSLHRSFRLKPGFEFTLEGNPESAGAMDQLESFARVGVNRLSLGVQSFNDEFLRILGRAHTVKQAVLAVRQARTMGFSNLSLDLIWGLPRQRLGQWLKDLKSAADLEPNHLSCYGLSIEPGSAMQQLCLNPAMPLPDEDEQAKMYVYGAEFLESRGFLQYEISNFARMGYQCRHNLGYWEGADYLGLGPAAVSTISGERWENPADLQRWSEIVESRGKGVEIENLDLAARIRELVMLRLRTARGLRLAAYRELTGRAFVADHGPIIRALRQNDLIRIRNGYLRLTRTGMLVSDAILANLFERDEE